MLVFTDYPPDHYLTVLAPRGGSQRGNGVPLYYGQQRQRGFGFFSALRSLGRFLLPIAKSTIIPAAKPAFQSFARGVLSDVVDGENVAQSLKRRGAQALRTTAYNVLQGNPSDQHGEGRRRRRRRLAVLLKLRKTAATSKRRIRLRQLPGTVQRRRRTRRTRKTKNVVRSGLSTRRTNLNKRKKKKRKASGKRRTRPLNVFARLGS